MCYEVGECNQQSTRKEDNMKNFEFVKVFPPTGKTFGAFYNAEKWLSDNGYSYGSTDRGSYVPIMKGEYDIPQKYYNLSKSDIANLSGVVHSTDYREGEVEVRLFEQPQIISHE